FGWQLFLLQVGDGIRVLSVTGVQTCALPIWYNGHQAVFIRLGFAVRSLPVTRRHPDRVGLLLCRAGSLSSAWYPRTGRARGRQQIGRASCRESGKNTGAEVGGHTNRK